MLPAIKLKLNNFDDISWLGLGQLEGIFGKLNGCAGIKVNRAKAEWFKG